MDVAKKKCVCVGGGGNHNRETESLLIGVLNNAIRTNHIKARIDKTQQNSRCRLCCDRDETINHIISECSTVAQKGCKTRHDLVGKGIHWESCQKLKFDHASKWYIHNTKSVQENETHKVLWDFDIQTDHLISARRPDLMISIRTDHRVKLKESEKEVKYLDLASERKKTMEHESEGDTNFNWYSWYSHERIDKETGGLGNKRTTALLRSTRILRRVLVTWGDLLSLFHIL